MAQQKLFNLSPKPKVEPANQDSIHPYINARIVGTKYYGVLELDPNGFDCYVQLPQLEDLQIEADYEDRLSSATDFVSIGKKSIVEVEEVYNGRTVEDTLLVKVDHEFKPAKTTVVELASRPIVRELQDKDAKELTRQKAILKAVKYTLNWMVELESQGEIEVYE
ncbi:MAG: hypothetical protein WCP03_02150 [Candidatus Saccharibacteria bacterium]